MTGRPRFTIGMTTYRRPALLRTAVASVLAQTDGDFELLIGNDDIEQPLTVADAGTDDPRVRMINHPARLGQRGNQNALLFAAAGSLFTWQADDDTCAPTFLERMGDVLRAERVVAAFCGYATIDESGQPMAVVAPGARLEKLGADFLSHYWRGQVATMALTGVYRTSILLSWGGLREFSAFPIAIMGEYFLLVRVGELPAVAYLPEPLVQFRRHQAGWSESQADPLLVEEAGKAFVRSAARVIDAPAFTADYAAHAAGVAMLAQTYVPLALYRSGQPRDPVRQLRLLATTFAAFGEAWRRHPAGLTRALWREGIRFAKRGRRLARPEDFGARSAT